MAIVQESRDLFAAYLSRNPNPQGHLDHNKFQADEIAAALRSIEEGPRVLRADTKMQIGVEEDKASSLLITNYPKLMVHELRVITDWNKLTDGDPDKINSLLQPYGPYAGISPDHIMRLLMVSRGALRGGNYPAMAEAIQSGEDLPPLGLKPREGRVNGVLRALRFAAVYDIKPDGRDRYVVEVDKPGAVKIQETWKELTKRFDHGTVSHMVMGRVANVGWVGFSGF